MLRKNAKAIANEFSNLLKDAEEHKSRTGKYAVNSSSNSDQKSENKTHTVIQQTETQQLTSQPVKNQKKKHAKTQLTVETSQTPVTSKSISPLTPVVQKPLNMPVIRQPWYNKTATARFEVPDEFVRKVHEASQNQQIEKKPKSIWSILFSPFAMFARWLKSLFSRNDALISNESANDSSSLSQQSGSDSAYQSERIERTKVSFSPSGSWRPNNFQASSKKFGETIEPVEASFTPKF